MKFGAVNKFIPTLLIAVILAMLLFTGCIADSVDDGDLPWASNKSWEGMTPLPMGMTNEYD